jgi:hypothetical protein
MAISFFLVSDEDVDALRKKLKDALGDGYEVETHKEVSALMGLVKETFDLAIFYHDDVICGIEYKYKAGGSIYYDRLQNSLIDRFKKVGLKYGFAYTETGQIYFWTKGSYGLESFSFDDMITAIKGNQTCGMRLAPTDIMTKFMKFIPDELNEELGGEQIKGLQALFTEDNLIYNEDKASMWLKTEAEDEFFKVLLRCQENDESYKRVCRYTSLNSLFLAMKGRNHVMCSITCMNDKGETSYADKYVGYGAFANTANSIKENNDCFILSCCKEEMEDNLTMWRLYGNDGKGVCLEYELDFSKIDNKEFFFGPVSYGMSMNNHPALEFVRQIRHWKTNGWRFELRRWYIWKHFFKSHLFKEEKEVRLLYIWTEKSVEKTEWIMDASNNIASRICKFSFDEGRLPLTLTKAIIGPKCPEQGSNVDQFNYMNRQTNTMPESWIKPAVRASKIEDYR